VLSDPGHDPGALRAAVRHAYGLRATELTFLPSHDSAAATYRVATDAGPRFLKVRTGPMPRTAALDVPRALADAGVPNLVPPIRTSFGQLTATAGTLGVVMQPWVAGRSAMDAGLSPAAWRAFGATLRAVHDSGIEGDFAASLPREPFDLPSAGRVRRLMQRIASEPLTASAAGLVDALTRHADRIRALVERGEELAAILEPRLWELVVCHADIHAANVLATDDGEVALVDWDGPMLAPRERDLMFVIGSRVARDVTRDEEAAFFAGYGPVRVDADAIRLFRCERILEDVAEVGDDILDRGMDGASAARWIALVDGFFAPGGIAETVETVDLTAVRPSAG
jgi:spectinomycin phosphotransferase